MNIPGCRYYISALTGLKILSTIRNNMILFDSTAGGW